jgi:hypothetical protein
MSGYNTILRIRRLETEVDKMGFRMGNTKHGNYRQEFGDVVALFPKEDSFPIYSRDAEMFVGTLEELEVWLRGFQKAQEYHRMLIGRNFEKKVERFEQDYRNRELMKKIKQAGQEEVPEQMMEA